MNDRLREIAALTRARCLVSFREPEAIFWSFCFPLLLTLILGYAFREGQVEPSRIAVIEGVDEETVTRLSRLDELRIEVLDAAEAERKLRYGAVDAVVLSGGPKPNLRFDPRRSEAIVAKDRVRLGVTPGELPQMSTETHDEAGSRYIDFLFPGILGLNLMGTGVWALAFALADMRQKRFMKRMLVTPMHRSSFLVSLLLYRLVFLVAEVSLLLIFGRLVLGVPNFGGLLPVLVLCFFGGVGFGALGLLVGSRTRTIEGASGLANLVLLPMWMGSGIFFSYERFPEFLHGALSLLPLSALNDGLRAVMLEGGGLIDVLFEVTVVAVWGVLSAVGALLIFRWE